MIIHEELVILLLIHVQNETPSLKLYYYTIQVILNNTYNATTYD